MKAKITIELPTELKTALVAEAAEQDIDLSKLCRRILKNRRVLTPAEIAGAMDETRAVERQIEERAVRDLAEEGAAGAPAAISA